MVTQVQHIFRACRANCCTVRTVFARQFTLASLAFDLKNRRIFLKRSQSHSITPSDLYIDSTINIHSRQLKIVDYGDQYTQKKLNQKKERTLGMIKPDAKVKMGQIIDQICGSGFLITKLKMCQLTRGEAKEFYAEHNGKPFFDTLLHYITSTPIIAFELMGSNAVTKWRETLGPTDSAKARLEAPSSIRAKFGTDMSSNAAHGSDSMESANREIEFFFPSDRPGRRNTAQFTNCTCCVIKPHAINDGIAGKIIDAILSAGFEISAMEMFHLDRANTEEFLEIYKDVVAEYSSMVEGLTTGPCIALEIRANDAPKNFREFVGPADPEIARHLRPKTLRALFGRDKIANAIHCTDLPEDGLLEVEYFFKILSK